jgi:hypothetical protein
MDFGTKEQKKGIEKRELKKIKKRELLARR